MIGIEIFIKLIGGHFIADYVFQTDAIATGKNRNIDPAKFGVDWWYWMTAHAITHGFITGFITGSVWIGLAETILHWIIDFLKCEGIINLHQDQLLHAACKVLWIIIMFL